MSPPALPAAGCPTKEAPGRGSGSNTTNNNNALVALPSPSSSPSPPLRSLAARRADREAHTHATVWTKDPPGGPHAPADVGGAGEAARRSAAATHAAYDAAVARLVPAAATGAAHLMVATHNQASVEATVRAMAGAGLAPSTPTVLFGQLCGMRDFLTLTLGAGGYRAFKILPYGPMTDCLLYLTRRAQENSDVLGNVGVDLDRLKAELGRRVLGRRGRA